MSVSGSNQGVRFGVATSSNRPATPFDGQVIYETDTDRIAAYDSSAWAYKSGDSGLVLVSSTTIGSAVSSVTVTGAFSATYDNYRITINGGVASASIALNLQLGATTTGYYQMIYRTSGYASTTQANAAINNGANFNAFFGTTGQLSGSGELLSPYLSSRTFFSNFSARASGEAAGPNAGFLDNATSYTDFTLLTSSGTITGGTIRVYGYKN